MSFLSYTKEKAMLAAALAIVGMLGFWIFSKQVLTNLDTGASVPALIAFVIFAALCIPMVIGIALISRLGSAMVVTNSTILAIAVLITLAYLYVVACLILALYHRLKQ